MTTAESIYTCNSFADLQQVGPRMLFPDVQQVFKEALVEIQNYQNVSHSYISF